MLHALTGIEEEAAKVIAKGQADPIEELLLTEEVKLQAEIAVELIMDELEVAKGQAALEVELVVTKGQAIIEDELVLVLVTTEHEGLVLTLAVVIGQVDALDLISLLLVEVTLGMEQTFALLLELVAEVGMLVPVELEVN